MYVCVGVLLFGFLWFELFIAIVISVLYWRLMLYKYFIIIMYVYPEIFVCQEIIHVSTHQIDSSVQIVLVSRSSSCMRILFMCHKTIHL